MSVVAQPMVINKVCGSVRVVGSALDLKGSRMLMASSGMCLVLCKLPKCPAAIKDFNIKWQFVRTAALNKDFLRAGWAIVSYSVGGIFS